MMYKFFWSGGKIDYTPAASGLDHTDLWMRTFGDEPLDSYAAGYYGNIHDSNKEEVVISWESGTIPNEKELAFIMRQELERYDKRSSFFPPITAATVEDTEPEYNFGFLKEPNP